MKLKLDKMDKYEDMKNNLKVRVFSSNMLYVYNAEFKVNYNAWKSRDNLSLLQVMIKPVCFMSTSS